MFIIVCLSAGCSESYEMYHSLKAKTAEEALVEAAEYLSDGGAPATGDPEDTFEVAQIISKPLKAAFSCLASLQENREGAKKLILRVLKGE